MEVACKILCIILLCVGMASAFSVSGNTLLDPVGKPIMLRGIARPSLEWNTEGQYLALADYTLMKNWGANAVRLSLNQCFWLASGTDGTNYQAVVDQQVTWIKSLGMAVILDLHWSNPSGSGCAQQQMADTYSMTFWDQVSKKYKNDALILFELYNEPHDLDWNVVINGNNNNFVGMQNLTDKIRGNGANNVVIVGGLNFGYDLSGVGNNPVKSTNVMYSTHPYKGGGRDQSNWDRDFGYLTPTYPIISTEFGDTSSCDTSYTVDFLNYANQHSISYTGWGWFVNDCSFPSIIADWNGTPSQQGQPIHDDLMTSSKIPSTTSNPTVSSTTTKITSSTGSNPTTATSSNPTTASTASSTTASSGTTTGNVGTGVNVTIYSDSVQVFTDGTWADPKNPSDTSYHHSGSASYSWTATNYEGMYFLGQLVLSQWKGLEFWVNGGSSGNQHIHFNIVKGAPASKFGPDLDISQYIGGGGIPTNNWVRGYIDFSKFPQDTYTGLWFESAVSGNEGTVYFDDIVLVAYPPASGNSGTSGTTKSATSSQSGNGATNSGTSGTTKSATSSQSGNGATNSGTSSQSGNGATNSGTSSQPGNGATNGDGATSAVTTQGTPAPTCSEENVGDLRCQCSQGGACNPGLVCLSGICVDGGDKIGAASHSSPLFALFSALGVLLALIL